MAKLISCLAIGSAAVLMLTMGAGADKAPDTHQAGLEKARELAALSVAEGGRAFWQYWGDVTFKAQTLEYSPPSEITVQWLSPTMKFALGHYTLSPSDAAIGSVGQVMTNQTGLLTRVMKAEQRDVHVQVTYSVCSDPVAVHPRSARYNGEFGDVVPDKIQMNATDVAGTRLIRVGANISSTDIAVLRAVTLRTLVSGHLVGYHSVAEHYEVLPCEIEADGQGATITLYFKRVDETPRL